MATQGGGAGNSAALSQPGAAMVATITQNGAATGYTLNVSQTGGKRRHGGI